MSVTFDTAHPLISPLNADAPLNMPLVLVTPDTSQLLRLPLANSAPENICAKDDTSRRSCASVAFNTMFLAPEKARSMEVHAISPHCSMDISLSLTSFPKLPSRMAGKLPVMDTV